MAIFSSMLNNEMLSILHHSIFSKFQQTLDSNIGFRLSITNALEYLRNAEAEALERTGIIPIGLLQT